MTYEMMVDSTLDVVKQFLYSGATGSVTVDVKPMTSITVKVSGIVVCQNGIAQHCVMPSVGYAKDLNS